MPELISVTAIEMETESFIEEPKEAILNIPFLYMIVDSEQNLPLFIGVLVNIN